MKQVVVERSDPEYRFTKSHRGRLSHDDESNDRKGDERSKGKW